MDLRFFASDMAEMAGKVQWRGVAPVAIARVFAGQPDRDGKSSLGRIDLKQIAGGIAETEAVGRPQRSAHDPVKAVHPPERVAD